MRGPQRRPLFFILPTVTNKIQSVLPLFSGKTDGGPSDFIARRCRVGPDCGPDFCYRACYAVVLVLAVVLISIFARVMLQYWS